MCPEAFTMACSLFPSQGCSWGFGSLSEASGEYRTPQKLRSPHCSTWPRLLCQGPESAHQTSHSLPTHLAHTYHASSMPLSWPNFTLKVLLSTSLKSILKLTLSWQLCLNLGGQTDKRWCHPIRFTGRTLTILSFRKPLLYFSSHSNFTTHMSKSKR